jgi:hypothetical protein
MAGDFPPVERAGHRPLGAAAVGHMRAARREHAAARGIEWRRQLAFRQHLPLPPRSQPGVEASSPCV